MDILTALTLFLMLLACACLGWAVQPRLRPHHVSAVSVDNVRLLLGMLLTFSALVLGLLTSSAKQRFDGFNAELGAYGAQLIELDHRLRMYGPQAEDIRALLRSYTAAAIADTWPEEPLPSGTYPRFAHFPRPGGVESTGLGAMLFSVDDAVNHLVPDTAFQRQIAQRLRDRSAEVMQQRWALILSARSFVSWPFLAVLAAWLGIIFGMIGLTAPRNLLVVVAVGLSALSIASPLYLILDYSGPLDGLLKLSSLPLRVALAHMDAPG